MTSIRRIIGGILAGVLTVYMISCTEEINTQDRFTATDYTIMSYLEYSNEAPNYTEYVSLLY
jgi:hypothetical protein